MTVDVSSWIVSQDLEKQVCVIRLAVKLPLGMNVQAPSAADEPIFSWRAMPSGVGASVVPPRTRSVDMEGFKASLYPNPLIIDLRFQLHQKEMLPNKALSFKAVLCGVSCGPAGCEPFEVPWTCFLSFKDKKFVLKEGPDHPQETLGSFLRPLQKMIRRMASLFVLFSSFLWLLFIAFLGGVVLNFMPCVLPVLGVKLMVFSKKRCPQGLLPVAQLWGVVWGIFAAFFILALLIIIFRLLGTRVGWGVQFQNVFFLSVMVTSLALFVANTWGFFEVRLPVFLQRASGSVHGQGVSGAFLTGIFSVLLATPCTAPFVGTAVGFALIQPPWVVLAIFSSLAFGFSSPYWVAALLPSHHLRLPKPGPWLTILRWILSLFLVGTMVWLVWLLSAPFGWGGFLFWGVGILGLWFFLWMRVVGFVWAPYGVWFLLVCLCCGPLLQELLLPSAIVSGETGKISGPHDLQVEKIPALVRLGYTVFVDVTADWCVMCHVNKKMVLETAAIKKMLKDSKVIFMRGDWTKKSPHIEAFLKKFGKVGVPLNVVFGPQKPEGVVLPALLSKAEVRDALALARGF